MPEQKPWDETTGSGAISGAGAGGGMDLAMDEGTTLEKTPGGPEGTGPAGKPRSLWSDAWRDLRRNPVFIISSLVILFLVIISIWPSLIADQTRSTATCPRPRRAPSPATPSASTARAATSTPAPSTAPGPR